MSRWLGNLLFWLVLLGLFFAFAYMSAPPEPTEKERAVAYAREYELQIRACLNDYPYEEQLKVETGQTYEECATARTAIAMDIWEAFYPTGKNR